MDRNSTVGSFLIFPGGPGQGPMEPSKRNNGNNSKQSRYQHIFSHVFELNFSHLVEAQGYFGLQNRVLGEKLCPEPVGNVWSLKTTPKYKEKHVFHFFRNLKLMFSRFLFVFQGRGGF